MSFAIAIHDRRRVAITAAALFVAALEAAAILHQLHKPPVMASGPAAVSAPMAPPASQHVDLSVERNGQSLRLRWDRNAPAIRDANHATLHIEDGIHQSQLDLDLALLHSGALSYWPETRIVEFRLELFPPGRTVMESIQAVNGTSAEPISPSTGHADRFEADQMHPSPFASPKSRRAVVRAAPKKAPAPEIALVPTSVAPPAAAAAPETPAKEEPPAPSPPPGKFALRGMVVPLPTPAAPDRDTTEVTVPARGGRWSRIAGKIPLLRRLVKHPQSAPESN